MSVYSDSHCYRRRPDIMIAYEVTLSVPLEIVPFCESDVHEFDVAQYELAFKEFLDCTDRAYAN